MYSVEICGSTFAKKCDLSLEKLAPTIICENNVTCIAQLQEGYIKGYMTKHILPKFFITHDLQRSDDINI